MKQFISIFMLLTGLQLNAGSFDKPVSIIGFNGFSVVSVHIGGVQSSNLVGLRCENFNSSTVIRRCNHNEIGYDDRCSIVQGNSITLNNVARFDVGNKVPAELFGSVTFTCD